MICVCDIRTPRSVLDSLNERGFDIVQLPPDPSLPDPVSGHSDLLLFIIDGYLLTREDYYLTAPADIDRLCKKARLKRMITTEKADAKYPHDCGLCAAISGQNLLYCEKSTDKKLLRLGTAYGYSLLSVPQGYTKCSCAILADGAIITSDEGIERVTRAAGIDTLLISAGHVDLPGYNYGFIGGASGLYGNTLYFAGRIEDHPNYEMIMDFSKKHGTELISLGNGKLYDVGSLLFI
jgi:hypothetical protein